MLSDTAISVLNVTKEYGQLRALDDISLQVKRGEVLGFMGPNGAGKTTTIRILTTLLSPSSGEVRILGYDARRDSDEIRRRTGYVQQQPSVEFFMTVRENLDTYGRLWGVQKDKRKGKSEFLAEKFGLEDLLNKSAVELSIGERRRLQVAREFMHDMELLFLDEPAVGLDPIVKRTLLDFIRQKVKQDGITVFFTTHVMSEAEYLCDRIVIIDKGRILASGTVDELKKKFPAESALELVFEEKNEETANLLESMPMVTKAVPSADGKSVLVCVGDPYAQAPRILNTLLKEGYHVTELHVKEPTLEDVFIQAVRQGGK